MQNGNNANYYVMNYLLQQFKFLGFNTFSCKII